MSRFVCLLVLCALVGCRAAPVDEIDDQIVGGQDTTIAKYPWQVSFRVSGSHICGGSIISQYWILTAAHCIKSRWVTSYRVVSVKVGSGSVSSAGTVYNAAAIYAHPGYNSDTYVYDVGLIKLSTPIIYTSNVQSVKIAPAGKDPAVGSSLRVSGWGALTMYAYYDSDYPDTLQDVTVSVVDRKACNDVYQSYKKKYQITSSMICASAKGKDSCQGDSGGPIVDSNTNMQVGVVSWGIGCAYQNFPGVYSNLANSVIRTWIKANSNV